MWIYKITNLVNNKIYVGLTSKTIQKRFEQHKKLSIKYKQGSKISLLYLAMRKHGISNFIIEPLKECFSKEDLIKQEIYFIALLDSRNHDIGYNITRGGTGGDCTSTHPNKKDIYKRAGNNKRGEKNGFYGKHHTEETKQKLSLTHVGRKASEEAKQKMSLALQGREITWGDKISEAKMGAGNAMYGLHHSEEHKKAISEKLKGVSKSPEHIQKLKEAWAERKAKKECIIFTS